MSDMIPDEAVEAAAKEFAAIADPLGGWDNQAASYQRIYTERAKRILEAAAPHLMAAAWEEGRLDGYADAQRGFDTAMNPYEGLPDA